MGKVQAVPKSRGAEVPGEENFPYSDEYGTFGNQSNPRMFVFYSNLYSLIISVAETEITDIYRTETTLKHWQNTEQVD